jgi:acetylornithine deacetylase/succinyl-diaminopimelate desuccinylase-like protein
LGSIDALERDIVINENIHEQLASRIDTRAEEFIHWLLHLAEFPSISATGEGVRECAEALVGLMTSLGIDTAVLETGGEPLVWGAVGEGSPTIIVYGHYDVQPPGSIESWRHPPFRPTISEGAIWGCGVGDNKGQLLAHLCALAAWLDCAGGPPPFRLIFAFDGEEEIGSPASSRYIAEHPEYFDGDALLVADGSSLGVEQPALFLNLHGLLYLELRATGPSTEWHSGSYGGLLPNPIHRLAQALAGVVNERGTVLVPGFYEEVVAPTLAQRHLLDSLPDHLLSDPRKFGVDRFVSSSPVDAVFMLPKLCICGFRGGYLGTGVKTAVPTDAIAKIDITLAPRQDPARVADQLRSHLDSTGFGDITQTVLASCAPVETSPDDAMVRIVSEALTSVWKKSPTIFPSIGGGGPFAAFASHGMTCVSVPYGQADLHEHSPEEHLSLEAFVNGIKTTAEIYLLLAERGASLS